ncbi:ARC6/PARC6 family protein [Gloeomargaritales cyanobacterium VI4D9]|nr:ARC6/PARC6 family protein [Gloeomargaritales cyanobacterium VI4D9]
MAVSYRQLLLERDGQPLNESQVRLLLQQVLSQLRGYHDRHQAHGGVSLSTIQQVPHGCQLVPPTRTPTTTTPQQDIVALARAAVTLLTGYPPSPDWLWQEHCEIDPTLAQVLTQMLAGAFDQAGQVLAVLVPEDFEATEFDTVPYQTPVVAAPTPPTQPMPMAAQTLPMPHPINPQEATKVPVMVLLLLGLGLGGVLTVAGALVWVISQRHSPTVVTTVPQATSVPSPQVGGSGGQKSAVAPTTSSFSAEDGVALVEAWLEAKKTIFAPPYDLDLAANFLTGPAWTDVAKQDGSVDWLRKNNTYYRYGRNQVTLKRVLKSTANHMVLDLTIQEQLNIYKNGRLRQSKTDRDTYRFDLRRVGDAWKIYDRRSVK